MLALQAVFGGCLAAFGSRALDLGMPYAAALAAMAITANAILVGLLAGPAGANPGGLLLLVSGVEVAGALACLGAARAADSSVWLLLTLGCTLVNMELVRAAAAMRLR
jgi:hypothetical protein